jgi:hypothetical protein
MNTGYLIHQAERAHSQAEQREIDRRAGEFAAATSRLWRSIVHSLTAKRNLLVRDERQSLDLKEPCHQVHG